jgi:hypothetical protein
MVMKITQEKKLIKLGIVINSFLVPKWIEKIINDIFHLEFVELKVVIVNLNHPTSKMQKNKNKHFLYNKYCEFDYKYYSKKVKKNAFEKINIEDSLIEVGKEIKIIRINYNEITKNEIEKLKKDELDLIIQFGIREIMPQLSGIPRNGVWYFPHDHFGGGYSAEPKFFKAMFNKNERLEISLNNLANIDKSKVIFKSQSSVNKESLFFNSNAVYWKSSQFIIRKLHDLYTLKIESANEASEVDFLKNIPSEPKLPSNLETINLLTNLAFSKIKSRMFYEQWFLAFKQINEKKESYNIIKPPLDRFYADPFIFKKDNKTYIFFEEFIYSKGKGDISVLEIDSRTNKCTKPICILDKPYHLSYPFIFEWEEEVYMIPETSENKTIEMYKSVDFPHKWELEKVLIDEINAVDATIIYHNKKFWMFANVFVDGSSSLDELHIFQSDNLLGEWESHKMNPVVSSASSARPAGKIFIKDGKLIRPSQDCSFSYGYSVKFSEISKLTEDQYSEKLIDELNPTWLKNNKGTHTFNFNEDYEVIDGRMLIRKF